MFISGVNDTGDKREKFWATHFFHILLRALTWVHFTLVDWIFAYFSFTGLGKLVLLALSYKNLSVVSLTPVNNLSAVSHTGDNFFWLFGYFWLVSTTPGNNFIAGVGDCCDDRGLFFLQDCEPLAKNKEAVMRRQQYIRPPGSDAATNGVIATTMKTKTELSPPAEVGHNHHRHWWRIPVLVAQCVKGLLPR
jgi:hypothetical protein